MPRMSIDDYFMSIALLCAQRSTCIRRQVGCVIVDESNHIISTGYNGNPKGNVHCIDYPCSGSTSPSGTNLESCEAIHAEINALARINFNAGSYKLYTTTQPCIHCIKSLLASKCTEIIFLNEYPHKESVTLWEKSGRLIRQHKLTIN